MPFLGAPFRPALGFPTFLQQFSPHPMALGGSVSIPGPIQEPQQAYAATPLNEAGKVALLKYSVGPAAWAKP